MYIGHIEKTCKRDQFENHQTCKRLLSKSSLISSRLKKKSQAALFADD
jgi:hypothetical protein